MSVPQSPVDGRRQGVDSRIPRPSSLTSPLTSPVPLRRAGSLRLRGEKGIPTAAPLTSPRQKHFPTISESSTVSPRHHRSLQSLTPRRPSVGASPNPGDDDDNDSLRSFGSTQSACDHAHFARNGTTFSGRRMKYVVHCSPQHEPEEYLTPTQRAARQERRLKALLAQARRDIETKDECIFRLTKEVVELRLLRGDAPPEGVVTEAGADATDSRARQNSATQWSKTNGFVDAQSPVADSACVSQSGMAGGGGDAGDGPPSGLATPVSLSDSGHFDDALTTAATNGSSPGGNLALDERRALLEHLERRLEEQARRHAERALEDRRALVELYERKMEEMSRRHVAQTQEERRELESAYEKRLIEAARALAEEKDRAEMALRERDARRLSVDNRSEDTSIPAGLERRLADALQRLQALQRSPSKEVKTGTEKESSWNASSIQRVEESLSNLEKRLAEERMKREDTLKTVENLSDEIFSLESRLAEQVKKCELAVEEADKLRESDLMNSVRLSDLETRLSEELRTREQNDGEAEALRERIRLSDARLADLEARLTEEIKMREKALKKIDEIGETLSLKEVRLAELERNLSEEIFKNEGLMKEAAELRSTIKNQAIQVMLEEKLEDMRTEEEREESYLPSEEVLTHLENLEKCLCEERVLKVKAMKEAEELREKVSVSEAVVADLERKLAEGLMLSENNSKQSNQVYDMAEVERNIYNDQRTQTDAIDQSSQIGELTKRISEERRLREESVKEVEQLRPMSLALAELERELEEEKLIRNEAINEAATLREELDRSEAREEDLNRRNREEEIAREEEVRVLRAAAAENSLRLADLQRRVDEEQKLREEIVNEAERFRTGSSRLAELEREVEEEKLIREEAISQGLALQERLQVSETLQAELENSLEVERRLREDAMKEAEELRETVSLLSSQLADLQKRFAEEFTSSEDRQRDADEVRGQLESLKHDLRAAWETRLTDLTLALEEEQRRADSCQSQLDQLRSNVQTASDVSQDLESRLTLATQAAEALEKGFGERLQQAEVPSNVSQDLDSRMALANQAAEAMEKGLGERLQQGEGASDVSQDLETRLALATQAAEALEKDLGERLQQAEQRCKELESERDGAAARVEELSKELKEQEERHKDINLEMYRKGQEAAKFERRDEVLLHAQAAPAVAVPELLAQLENTEKELDKLKAMYRRLVDSQAGPSNPEATLMFLKSAFYYFLTDEANSQGHLNAIQSILGFSELERHAVESHTYFRR